MAAKTKRTKAKRARFTKDLYPSRREAERDARRHSQDPDWKRKVRVVKRTAYTLAWGARKSRDELAKARKHRTPIF